MDGEVRLDPDSLRQDSARLSDLGDRVGRTYTGLRDCLAYAEGCWGDDDLGAAFARDFTPHADRLLADLQALKESVHGTARDMLGAGSDFESQDRDGAGRMAQAADGPFRADRPPPAGDTRPTSSDASPPTRGPAVSSPSRNTGDSRSRLERPSSGGPGTSAGPGAPQNDPQQPDGSADASNGRGGATPPEGRRPRPRPAAAPPAARPDAPHDRRAVSAPSGAASLPKPSAVGAGGKQSPWTGSPGAPRGAPTGESNPPSPRSGSPPRTPTTGEPRERDRRNPATRPADGPRASAVLLWLARALAHRHGVEVVGFDLPDLDETAVRDFAAAIDRVLTDHPMIGLDVVAVADLGDDARTVRWAREPRDAVAATRTLTLDLRTVGEPDSGSAATDHGTGRVDSAVYAATVGELGLALNSSGGGVAGRSVQHTLIAAYMRVMAGRYTTLGELVRGYRRWRAELAGVTGEVGPLDEIRAVSAAFADVVLHGDQASAPAKALYAVLVGAASSADR